MIKNESASGFPDTPLQTRRFSSKSFMLIKHPYPFVNKFWEEVKIKRACPVE